MGQLDVIVGQPCFATTHALNNPRFKGVYLLGLLFNTFLYGLVMAQFLTYFNTKSNDPLWIKYIVVWSLLCVDTIHSAVEFYAVWETGVNNYGNLASFASVSWTIPFTAVATSVAAIITQLFLAFRVFSFTKSKVLVGIICLTSTLGLVFGCIAGIRSGIIGEVSKFAPLVPFVVLWLAFQSFSDFLITVSLIVALLRSRTGFRKTDTIIRRLIGGAIETGLFASAFALADLFSFVFWRDTNLYAMFAYPLGRIYTNTLLHTLNIRANLKNMDTIIDCDSEANAGAFRLRNQNKTLSSGITESVPVQTSGEDSGKMSMQIRIDSEREVVGSESEGEFRRYSKPFSVPIKVH
ncbi:hypothetical protein B0H10DRAFT_1806973 [Mycena sp. CBHHK59/15]|nr:hypothetical protein B0H10DRAFT_1806973 [Mycena sp. CBHHK59/15]